MRAAYFAHSLRFSTVDGFLTWATHTQVFQVYCPCLRRLNIWSTTPEPGFFFLPAHLLTSFSSTYFIFSLFFHFILHSMFHMWNCIESKLWNKLSLLVWELNVMFSELTHTHCLCESWISYPLRYPGPTACMRVEHHILWAIPFSLLVSELNIKSSELSRSHCLCES